MSRRSFLGGLGAFGGDLGLPDGPGLGVEMYEEAVRKVQMKGTPWFEPTA